MGKKNPIVRTAYIVNDHEFADQVEDEAFKESILMLQVGGEPNNEDLRIEYEKQKAEVAQMRRTLRDEYSMKFKFRAIGRKAFDKLIDDNPLTQERREEFVERLKRENPEQSVDTSQFPPYDPETFAPALCAASLIEPIGFDVVGAWEDPDWSQAELSALFSAALEANTTRRIVKLGNV